MSKGITSVEGFIRKVFKVQCDEGRVLYFRGHSNKVEYRLEPSLYRKVCYQKNEHKMFNDLIASKPAEFSSDSSTFEKLVRMQHHSLPTRLLDITSNPLMALYFACDGSEGIDGEVVFLKITESNIKFFNSDTVSCLSNLCHLSDGDKDTLTSTDDADIKGRLIHFIREEKPYFQECIKYSDLSRVLCVTPKMSNKRIEIQSGSFLLFGNAATLPESGDSDIEIERVAISHKSKEKILNELSQLNINVSTVYPLLDNSAKFITNKYKS